MVRELQAALRAREVQLERKFEEVASMHDVTQQLMVLSASSIVDCEHFPEPMF